MASSKRQLSRIVASNKLVAYDSQASVNADLVSATPVVLLNVLAQNKNAPVLFLMFFDMVTAPTAGNNGAVPVTMPIALTQNTPLNLWFTNVPGGNSMFGFDVSNGLAYAISTTSDTLTIDATSSVWVNLRYQT